MQHLFFLGGELADLDRGIDNGKLVADSTLALTKYCFGEEAAAQVLIKAERKSCIGGGGLVPTAEYHGHHPDRGAQLLQVFEDSPLKLSEAAKDLLESKVEELFNYCAASPLRRKSTPTNFSIELGAVATSMAIGG